MLFDVLTIDDDAKRMLDEALNETPTSSTLHKIFEKPPKRSKFENALANAWFNYRGRRAHKPLSYYPTPEELLNAVSSLKKAQEVLANGSGKFSRIYHQHGDVIRAAITSLDDALMAFNSLETRKKKPGRQAIDPLILNATRSIVEALEIAINRDLPATSEYASGARGENVFVNEQVEFLYHLMRRIEVTINRSTIASMLRRIKENAVKNGE